MHYQAVERAWCQTNERTRPVFQFVRLARQPIVAESEKVRAIHQQSDFVFAPRTLDETMVGRLSRNIQVGSV
jgi:hypothetical protein